MQAKWHCSSRYVQRLHARRGLSAISSDLVWTERPRNFKKKKSFCSEPGTSITVSSTATAPSAPSCCEEHCEGGSLTLEGRAVFTRVCCGTARGEDVAKKHSSHRSNFASDSFGEDQPEPACSSVVAVGASVSPVGVLEFAFQRKAGNWRSNITWFGVLFTLPTRRCPYSDFRCRATWPLRVRTDVRIPFGGTSMVLGTLATLGSSGNSVFCSRQCAYVRGGN